MSKDEICPVATTLDLIGGKYKALILWHLADGKHRFSELRRMVSDATPKMLTQQLRELEAQKKNPVPIEDRARELVQQFLHCAFTSRELLVSLIERIELTESKEIIIRFRFREPEAIF